MCSYATGSSEIEVLPETQRQWEFEQQYSIKVAPIIFPSPGLYDFVYIDSNTIIIVDGLRLVEINMSTGRQRPIGLPVEWSERRFEGFRDLYYDPTTNSLHTTFLETSISRGGIGRSYHILDLENYTWESIDELGDNISFCWYDAENMLIYIEQSRRNQFDPQEEERDPDGFVIRTITVFDLRNREVLDTIVRPREIKNILCMYGNPLKILASGYSTNIESRYHYIIYDTATRTTEVFIESTESTIDSKINFLALGYYTPINDEGCFLGVDRRRENKSGIVLVDLKANTIETVILDDFPYTIDYFKKIAEGKYGFMVRPRNSNGRYGQSFLCFLDYP
jgi:hypothetical protein